jgi:hypothetical protein
MWLWVTLASGAGFALAVVGPWDVLGPALATRSLGGQRLRPRAARPLLTATALNLLYIPALVAFALTAPVVVIAAAAFVGGAANDACLVLLDTTIQRLVPREVVVRVISFDWFSDAALKPLGMAAVGPLGASAGIWGVFWSAALGVVAVTVLTLTGREVRSMGIPPGYPSTLPGKGAPRCNTSHSVARD